MANLNSVMLMGNITRDLELKYMPNQTAVADFGLAINRSWKDRDGNKKEDTTFVDCSCFGKTAEILSQYKKKGDPLFVSGRLKLDQWEAQDGTKRSKMRVIVESFQFLNRGPGAGEGNSTPAQRPQSQRQPAAVGAYQGEDDGPPLKDEDIPF